MQRKTAASDVGGQQLVAPVIGGCLPPADTITRSLATSINGSQLCMMNSAEAPFVATYEEATANHKCHRCCLVFPNQEYLTRHLSWHSAEERKLQCSRCSEVFDNELLHDAHQQLHAVNAVHGCSFCMGKFCHRLALKRHMIRCGAQRTTGWLFANGVVDNNVVAAGGGGGGTFSPAKSAYQEYDINHSSVGSSQSCPESVSEHNAGGRAFAMDLDASSSSSVPSFGDGGGSFGYTSSLEDGGCRTVQSEPDDAWFQPFGQSFLAASCNPDLTVAWTTLTPYSGQVYAANAGWQYAPDALTNGHGPDVMMAGSYGCFNNEVVMTSPPQEQLCSQEQQLHFDEQQVNGMVYRNYQAPPGPSCTIAMPGCNAYGQQTEGLTCSACSLLFESSEQLHDHFIGVHVLDNYGAPNHQPVTTTNDWELPPTPCPICGICFEGEETLRSHILTDHRPDKRFRCNCCGQMFNRRQTLKKHVAMCSTIINGNGPMATDDGGPPPPSSPQQQQTVNKGNKTELKCRYCSKVFVVKRNLKQHESSQHNDKPDELTHDEHNNEHMTTTETNGAVLSCPLCPKTFSVAKLLKQHVSFHARANAL